jgi:tRNA pseudouridine38-40 synthase
LNTKFVFAYDGSRYFGSQKQTQKKAVANEFLKAFAKLNITSQFVLSGRTDKGVHATRQVANISLPSYWSDTDKLQTTLQAMLPPSIQLISLSKVADDFHSRYQAKKRVYRYIVNQNIPNVFESSFVGYEPSIDEKLISTAIGEFVGIYDFRQFCKKHNNNTKRQIYNTKFYKYKEYFVFKFVGRSFLRGQIRAMVQYLFDISSGKKTIDELQKSLKEPSDYAVRLCPPNGLYLMKVIY